MKSRAFTDPLIPGHFGQFPSVRNRDKTKTCSEVGSVQGNAYALEFAHSDRGFACIRWRGKAQVDEKKGFHGPMDYRVLSVSSPSVRNRDKTKSCSEVDSVQGNV